MAAHTARTVETTDAPIVDDVYLTAREAWALVGAQPLAQLSNMALLPALGAMRADLDLSYSELGIVVAAFGFARLVTDLPAGWLARRWNPRDVLLTAFAISTVASALGLVAANAVHIAIVRLAIGIASSVAQAMILAWLVGGAGRAARGRVMARSEAFFSVAGLLIPTLSGALAGPLGWRVAFLLGAIAAAIGFLAVLLLTRPASAARAVGLDPVPFRRAETSRSRSSPPDDAAALSRPAASAYAPSSPASVSASSAAPSATESSAASRSSRARSIALGPATLVRGFGDLRHGGRVLVAMYIVTFVVFFCRNGLLNAVLPVMGADRFGLAPSEIGVLFSAINALSIGVVLLGGRAGDRFGRARLLGPGLAVLLACQLTLFTIHDTATYIILGLLQAVSFFVNPLPPGVLGDALPPRARPQAIAVYRGVSDLALLAAPALMGAALQLGGFPAAQLASVLVIGVALACVIALSRPRRHP